MKVKAPVAEVDHLTFTCPYCEYILHADRESLPGVTTLAKETANHLIEHADSFSRPVEFNFIRDEFAAERVKDRADLIAFGDEEGAV